jgi:hypothetical protein
LRHPNPNNLDGVSVRTEVWLRLADCLYECVHARRKPARVTNCSNDSFMRFASLQTVAVYLDSNGKTVHKVKSHYPKFFQNHSSI